MSVLGRVFTLAAAGALAVGLAQPAAADGRADPNIVEVGGWRDDGPRWAPPGHRRRHGPPPGYGYYAPPPRYYAPPPRVYYAPPPPRYYYPPPPPPPGIGLYFRY